MVVCAEEDVEHDVSLRDGSEKSSHRLSSLEITLRVYAEKMRGSVADRHTQKHDLRGGKDLPPLREFIYAKKSLFSVIGSIYSPYLYTLMLPDAISSMSITLPSAS